MPHQRKARTKSTETFTVPRHERKLQSIRAQIAAEAARIMATEGQHDFHAAKRKAAERTGINDRLALPSNLEVQEALLAYQSLYGGHQHRINLEKLRRAAVAAMRLLDDYSPRLVGPVLEGTADEHCQVTLQVFCDTAETLVLDFLERGLLFRQEQKRLRTGNRNYVTLPVFLIEVSGCSIELLLLPKLGLRQPLPSPIDGRPQQRANLTELERLLN